MVQVENSEYLRASELKFGESFRLLAKVNGGRGKEASVKNLLIPPTCIVTRAVRTEEGRRGEVQVQGHALRLSGEVASIPLVPDDIVERVNIKVTVERK